MKGLKERDKVRHVDAAKTINYKRANEKHSIMAFTYLDMVPLEFTRENVMEWLANSGWIEGMIIRNVGDLFAYLDDYIQEIYILLFDKIDKLIEIYETRGILAFCGYVKIIVNKNCYASGTPIYKKIRKFSKDFTVSCDDVMWNNIIDTYDADTMPFYKFNKTNILI